MPKIKGENNERPSRLGHHITRITKGHPRRTERRERALERLAIHVYNPDTCGPNCPKKPNEKITQSKA